MYLLSNDVIHTLQTASISGFCKLFPSGPALSWHRSPCSGVARIRIAAAYASPLRNDGGRIDRMEKGDTAVSVPIGVICCLAGGVSGYL